MGELPADLVAALGRARAHATRFNPRMADLRACLLQEGGREVLFAYAEPDVADLLRAGRRFAHRVQGLPGPEPTGCHHNVIAFWQGDPGGRFRIATGYGLNPYGIWIQHSWLVDSQLVIYETTTSFFESYFGIIYSEAQARRFAQDMTPPSPMERSNKR